MYHPKGQKIIRIIKGVEKEKKIIQKENIFSTILTHSYTNRFLKEKF